MDTFLWLFIIGGFFYYRFKKREKESQQETQRLLRVARESEENRRLVRLAREEAEAKTAKKLANTTSAVKSTAKKIPAPSSQKRPTYEGPLFAQPGEKSRLFSYASYSGKYELDAPFSLIDFETSGFHPNNSRILEVAVIKIDASGEILDEYSTLINQEDGSVGRTDIHQITLAMVKKAPTLSEVMGDLLAILDSSIVVAHNAKFEENFLEAAFREVGIKHPLMPTIDTLWLSRQVLNLPNYKLGTVIDEFGVRFPNAHTALGDVQAMAQVVPEMLEMSTGISFPSRLTASPEFTKTGKTFPRKSNA